MVSMRSLLDPKTVAVVGASQRRGRGSNVVANLRDCGFAGEIFAVNPRYRDVLGYFEPIRRDAVVANAAE
jgi:acyl-CoA synthetase (NDP forming)